MASGISSWHKWLKPKRLAIFEACLIGVVAGLAAVMLKQGIGWIGGWRLQIANDLPAWIALPVIGLTGGYLSGFLIEQFAPEASGSGIPQVKAALGYVPIANPEPSAKIVLAILTTATRRFSAIGT